MSKRLATTFIVFAVTFTGCDMNSSGPVDSLTSVPLVAFAIVNPDTVKLDSITPTQNTYRISAVVMVKANPRGSLIQAVTATVVRPSTSDQVAHATLQDNGISPDQSSRDSIYTGILEFDVTRALSGRYRIQCACTNSDGSESNHTEISLQVLRRNSPPTISDLVAPDTVFRPTSGPALFSMSIAASDSDGLADVTQVYFKNLDSPSQQKIFLLDDGGVLQPNGVISGDALAGDGRFSVIVQLPDTVSARTFRFLFQAADTFGDTSQSLLHPLVVR